MAKKRSDAGGRGKGRTSTNAKKPDKRARRRVAPARECIFTEPGADDCPVVGIGTSAGGFDACCRFFEALPADTGMAFVLIQHHDPGREGVLAEFLTRSTSMPLVQVDRPTRVLPDRVYVNPPDRCLELDGATLLPGAPIQPGETRTPIDAFFRSLAAARGARSACVVLSGTGADGTMGMREVQAAGGMIVAQEPDTAEQPGMLRSAIRTGQVDCVLPVGEIPEALVDYARHPFTRPGSEQAAPLHLAEPDAFSAIMRHLQARTGCDFRGYRKGTLDRRIQRRMRLRHVERVADYVKLLGGEDLTEVRALFKDLLIGVTRFFRDASAWQALQEEAIATLVAGQREGRPLRAWVPGCATGEEAYSVAIAFREEFERQEVPFELQLFGTDPDEESIATARAGLYPATIAAEVSADRLRRFFSKDGEQYRLLGELRESALFAVQNLISDPPFSNLDLISCRNVLIYLEPEVQNKLIRLFHFALREGGYLALGSSESVPQGTELFEPVSGGSRLFRRAERSSPRGAFPVVDSSQPARTARAAGAAPAGPRRPEGPALALVEFARKTLLDRFAPPSVLIDQDHEVHYFHGELREYLTVPTGAPTRDLLAMAADGLRATLHGLIGRAAREGRTVSAIADGVRNSGPVRVTARPVSMGRMSLVLVSFDVRTSPPDRGEDAGLRSRGDTGDAPIGDRTRQLRSELQATREDLQGTIEELETSNEELKASNEEVTSTNEALQSTNEQLRLSRQEFQALNEELSAVNSELEEKVGELEAANDDLSNLLSSAEIATVFLDTEFRIRRYTPACLELLDVIPGDVGRPITDLASRVNQPELLEDAQRVLRRLTPAEREVRNAAGRTLMRRILPYRTSDDRIQGVVVTFTDVTTLQRARTQLEKRERQQGAVARLGRLALSSKELQPVFDHAVRLIAETLEVDMAKVLEAQPDGQRLKLIAGLGWKDGLVGEATVPASIGSQGGYTLHSRGPVIVTDLKTEKRFSGPSLLVDHGVVSGLSVLIGSEHAPWGVLGAHTSSPREFTIDDVNFLQSVAHVLSEAIRRRRSEQLVLDRERRLDLIADAMPVLIAYCDRDMIYRYCNAGYEHWFGLRRQDIVGKPVVEVVGEESFRVVGPQIRRALEGERVTFEQRLRYRHGPDRHVLVDYIPHATDEGEVVGYYAMIADITDRVKAEHARTRLAAIVEHSHDAIIGMGPDGIITSWNAAAERMYGYSAGEAVGQPLNMLAPEDREQEIAEILQRIEGGEATEQLQTVRRRKDGTPIDVLLAVSPVRGPAGEIVGASSIAHDITGRVRAERELEEWTDRLEERVAERTAVAERRAADLRELASQVTHAERRARERLARAIHDDLQQVLVATKMRVPTGKEMASAEELKVVAELLDEALSKSRALVSELSPPILRDGTLADAMQWLARHMTGRYDLHVEADCEAVGDVDENVKVVVFEAVRELLFNVVKHAETDRAVVRLRHQSGRLDVRVSDNGKGFEPPDSLHGSDGFGLLSVRERVVAFGGDLVIDAAPGDGARFHVTLPLERKMEPPIKLRQPPRTRSKHQRRPASREDRAVRILVIDDHRIMREGLVRILASEPGLEVVGEAADGQEAVEKTLELRPDVVLMDITMPRMNGIEATREIVERLPSTIVIGLSLHDESDLGVAIQEAGAIAYLRKDAASHRLIELIRRHCGPVSLDSGDAC